MASHNDNKHIDVLCVPTEAGTHWAGQTKAPLALLETAGLAEKLKSVGYELSVHEKVLSSHAASEAAAWMPSATINGVRNEQHTLTVMHAVRDYLRNEREQLKESFPIVIGGDCSITPAVLSAFNEWHTGKKVGLLYIDGDADLTLPSQTWADGSTAIMDSMTMSHLTGRAGGLESMRAFAHADGSSLVRPDNIVLFGFDPLQPSTEHWVYLLENGFKAFTRPTVQDDPIASVEKALAWLSASVDVIYVHFDVDVIDCGEFPLANYPHYAGIGFDQVMAALQTALASTKVKGLTITEVNPNNDPSGDMVRRVVDGIVEGMQRR